MRVLYQSNSINNHNTTRNKKQKTTNILYILKKENIYTLQIFIMISNFFDLLASLIQKPSSNYTHLRPYHSRQISISDRVAEIHQQKRKMLWVGRSVFFISSIYIPTCTQFWKWWCLISSPIVNKTFFDIKNIHTNTQHTPNMELVARTGCSIIYQKINFDIRVAEWFFRQHGHRFPNQILHFQAFINECVEIPDRRKWLFDIYWLQCFDDNFVREHDRTLRCVGKFMKCYKDRID